MKPLRFVIVLALASAFHSASANPDILKKFKEVYNKPNANCQVCHTKPPQRNEYGKAVEAALDKSGGLEATAQIFQSIESADSDGDGSSNGDEIKADTLPGDPTSKPAPKSDSTPPAATSTSSELIPKHTFHPAIIHFPIALLAIAAFLQLLAHKKKDDIFHQASVINLAIGLVCSTGAIVTGIIAWQRLGYKLEGNLLIHLIVASLSIAVGTAAYLQREKPTYLWLILISGLLVMVAGHFGGSLIYG